MLKFLQKNFTTIAIVFFVLLLGMQVYMCMDKARGCGCNGKKSDNGNGKTVPGANKGNMPGSEPSPLK